MACEFKLPEKSVEAMSSYDAEDLYPKFYLSAKKKTATKWLHPVDAAPLRQQSVRKDLHLAWESRNEVRDALPNARKE